MPRVARTKVSVRRKAKPKFWWFRVFPDGTIDPYTSGLRRFDLLPHQWEQGFTVRKLEIREPS